MQIQPKHEAAHNKLRYLMTRGDVAKRYHVLLDLIAVPEIGLSILTWILTLEKGAGLSVCKHNFV
jgi:hypothetical protein